MEERICDNCMNRVPADAEKCPKCGIRFENTNPGGALPNGWVLGGRYTIGRYLEIDGEGVTYSAIDGNTLQRVLVKEFMPVTLCASRDTEGGLIAKPGCEVLFKTTRMDFAELYNTLLRLGLSEGLVQVLDVLEENNTAYAVLEKIEGPTLTEYLVRQPGPVNPDRALSILRPILLGVESMHAANVVHRGISPDNIILESGGTAKLGGFATLALRQQGSELKSKLYPGFSAPEQYTAAEFEGPYTDVYALGAVLYRMLTGETPESADERKMQDNLQPARAMNKELPTFLSTALQRAMRLNSGERIQNISDYRMALSGEGGRSANVKPAAAKDGERGLFGLTKQQLIVGGVVLGVVAVLLIVVLFVRIFGGKSKDPSSSLSASTSISVNEMVVPNFEGMFADSVLSNTQYTDLYKFGTPVEEYNSSMEKGRIISQTPAAGSAYTSDVEIIFVVSKGGEPVDMPDFAKSESTRQQAIDQLKEFGFKEENIKVETQDNDGSYKENTVIKTEPAAGKTIIPGETEITIYIASAASTTVMPDITGDSQAKAIDMLVAYGFNKNNITVSTSKVANDKGKQFNGAVASTDPAPGATVSPGGQKVTLRVYENYKMPNLSELVGKSQGEAEAYCTARGIPFRTETETATNVGAGQVSRVDFTRNVEVTDSTVVTIYIAEAPPAPPPEATE